MEFTTKIRDETGAPNFKEILNFLTFLQETFTPLITQRDGGKSVKTLDATKVTPVLKKHSPCQNKKIPDVKSPEEFPALGVQTKKSTWYVLMRGICAESTCFVLLLSFVSQPNSYNVSKVKYAA